MCHFFSLWYCSDSDQRLIMGEINPQNLFFQYQEQNKKEHDKICSRIKCLGDAMMPICSLAHAEQGSLQQ